MRVAVVGHVEWVQFARVERVPRQGEIVHAQQFWEQAAGGGAVAAVALARLGAQTSFFTALGSDELGPRAAAELEARGLRLHAARREQAQRRAFTFIDREAERTITVIGPRIVAHGADPLPWDELEGADAVYFTGGDADALRAARAARVLVATPRARESIAAAGVVLDALVHSGSDQGERIGADEFDPPPRAVVTTEGPRGGRYVGADGAAGRFEPAPLSGPAVDAYGAGDSFAAGLTYGLGRGLELADAVAYAARVGAACLTGRGPYEAELPQP